MNINRYKQVAKYNVLSNYDVLYKGRRLSLEDYLDSKELESSQRFSKLK